MSDLYSEALRLPLDTGAELEVFVRARNDGKRRPQCLLLHGNPGTLLDWEQLIPRLAEVADVAAIDLPGFGKCGRSGSEPQSVNLERLAQHAVSALDGLGWREPVFVLGHSHGGGVAQMMAALYPERIAGLALMGTLGAPVHASYRLLSLPGAAVFVGVAGRLFRSRRLRPLSLALLRRAMTDIFAPEPVPLEKLESELALLASRPTILVSMVHVAVGRPCDKLLASAPAIRCPTLFLHGSRDRLVPERCARTIHERIVAAGGRSEFELISGAGHMLIAYQAEELVQRICQRLLVGSRY